MQGSIVGPLHLPTLLVMTSAVTAFAGLVLVMLGRGPQSAAPRCWGGAMLTGAAGIVLMAAGEPPASTGLAGYTLVLLGTGLSWTGARLFIGAAARPAVVLAGPLLWLACALLPAVPREAHTLAAQLTGVAYTFAAAAELWRGREERLRSRNFAIALLVLHGAVYLLRAGSIAAGWGEGHANAVATALMLEALLHTLGMAFALLAILKERAEVRSNQRLRALALMDGLTGLGNRRQFDAALEHEHGRAVAERTPLGLLMLDADCFKAYNDEYGHQAGDDALRALARALDSAVRRPSDTAARYGGEEFALLLPRTDEAGAMAVAEAVHARVGALNLRHNRSPHGRLTVSIGVAAVRPLPGADPSALVRGADHALYAAKASGRGCTVAEGSLARPAPRPGTVVPLRAGAARVAGEAKP